MRNLIQLRLMLNGHRLAQRALSTDSPTTQPEKSNVRLTSIGVYVDDDVVDNLSASDKWISLASLLGVMTVAYGISDYICKPNADVSRENHTEVTDESPTQRLR